MKIQGFLLSDPVPILQVFGVNKELVGVSKFLLAEDLPRKWCCIAPVSTLLVHICQVFRAISSNWSGFLTNLISSLLLAMASSFSARKTGLRNWS